MAAFQIKKGAKVYQVRAFSSVVKLAERGLLAAEDSIFLPSLGQWVYAGSIKELRPLVGAAAGGPAQADDLPAEDPTEDGIELPMAYVEALGDDELPLPDAAPPPAPRLRPMGGAELGRRAPDLVGGRSPRPPLPEAPRFDPGPLAALEAHVRGADPLRLTEEGALRGGASGAPVFNFQPITRAEAVHRRPPPSLDGITMRPASPSISVGRVLMVAALPALAFVVWFLGMRGAAVQTFPEAQVRAAPTQRPVAGAAQAREPEVYGLATPENPLRALETELREKVPLELRNPVRAQAQVQDDIFAEMLNGGAFPQTVAVVPLVGEVPPHSAMRSLEVRVSIQIRETTRMDTRDQVALAALIVGKYQRFGGLRISELEINVRSQDSVPLDRYVFSGVQARDFYSREVSLETFFGWLEA